MNAKINILLLVFLSISISSCKQKDMSSDTNILFLHHSTGEVIWNGKQASLIVKAANKISPGIADAISSEATLVSLVKKHNTEYGKDYLIDDLIFPKESPYGWKNYPYDYYNIWVKNGGDKPYLEEPTLEILTKEYQVIIFKHCFPVSNIQPDMDKEDINSEKKTLANYKLQYLALREKLHEFPENKFILFTGAAQVKSNIDQDKAERARTFFEWVVNEWDQEGDNIYLWDLYNIQTDGELYLKEDYASSSTDSHPGSEFASKAVNLLFNRIIDVVENNGSTTTLEGKKENN